MFLYNIFHIYICHIISCLRGFTLFNHIPHKDGMHKSLEICMYGFTDREGTKYPKRPYWGKNRIKGKYFENTYVSTVICLIFSALFPMLRLFRNFICTSNKAIEQVAHAQTNMRFIPNGLFKSTLLPHSTNLYRR